MNPELCVGAVVVVDGELLLIRRGRGVGQGLWSIPGGRVEWGEAIADAVERELLEETALVGRAGRFLGIAERVGGDHHFVILDYLVDVEPDARRRARAGDDAAALAWAPLADVAGLPDVVDGLIEFLQEAAVLPR